MRTTLIAVKSEAASERETGFGDAVGKSMSEICAMVKNVALVVVMFHPWELVINVYS